MMNQDETVSTNIYRGFKSRGFRYVEAMPSIPMPKTMAADSTNDTALGAPEPIRRNIGSVMNMLNSTNMMLTIKTTG